MVVDAELVGGPIDGSRFTVPEPPPMQWLRRPNNHAGGQLVMVHPDLVMTSATPGGFERYARDDQPGPDGVWRYRWQGLVNG